MNKKGFTLIELLIVGAVIGLLIVVAFASSSFSRAKARDSLRIADVSRVQAALELYFNENNSYPIAEAEISLGEGTDCDLGACATLSVDAGFSSSPSGMVLMSKVPSNPKPNGSVYKYTSVDGVGYTIGFMLEKDTGNFEKGIQCATKEGIDSKLCI